MEYDKFFGLEYVAVVHSRCLLSHFCQTPLHWLAASVGACSLIRSCSCRSRIYALAQGRLVFLLRLNRLDSAGARPIGCGPRSDLLVDVSGFAPFYLDTPPQLIQWPTMRLGPTFNEPPRLTEHRRLFCCNCKAEFSSLQVIKINDKQLCIWCAGHPGATPCRSFTLVSQTRVSKRRIVHKDL